MQHQVRQQGEYESLHRDMMVGFGKWSWSPLELEDPFPGGEGKVHLWHGAEDLIVHLRQSLGCRGTSPRPCRGCATTSCPRPDTSSPWPKGWPTSSSSRCCSATSDDYCDRRRRVSLSLFLLLGFRAGAALLGLAL